MSASNPFIPLVGLRGVSPSTRQWVNDLPGISSELVTNLAQPSDRYSQNNDAEDIAVMWNKVHRNAYSRLVQEVLLSLSESVDFQPVIARLSETTTTELATVIPADPQLHGIQITLPYVANVSLNLRSISFIAQSAANARILVYSVTTNAGEPIYDEVQAIEPGFNEIPLTISLTARMLRPMSVLVLVDTSELALTQLTRPSFMLDGAEFGFVQGIRAPLAGPITGVQAAPVVMALTADLSRSIEGLLPRYANELTNAYALFCGSAILTEKLASPNLTVFTLSNRAFSDRMDDKYNADARRALKVVTRRMLADLFAPTVTPAGQTLPDAVTNRTDGPSIEIGGYV